MDEFLNEVADSAIFEPDDKFFYEIEVSYIRKTPYVFCNNCKEMTETGFCAFCGCENGK